MGVERIRKRKVKGVEEEKREKGQRKGKDELRKTRVRGKRKNYNFQQNLGNGKK